MARMLMSDFCKSSLTEQFGFKNSELIQIENFMNQENEKTAREIIDILIRDKKLNIKQKIIIAYVIGNSSRDSAMKEEKQKKDIYIDTSILPIGG